MKKNKILTAVSLYVFVILCPCFAQKDTIISGKITDVEGEYVYIDFDQIQDVEKGMIFGIYSADNKPVAICEISKFRVKNSFVAFILMQVEDVQKGYNVFSSKGEEARLREKIKNNKGNYYDFYKDFTASKAGDVPQETADEFLSYQIFIEAIEFLKLDINMFRKYNIKARDGFFLNIEEKKMLETYRDIILEGSSFSSNRGIFSIKSKINVGKLKYRLTQQGYSLKPKIIRLVFSLKTSSDDIKAARDLILENSIYVSTEEINSQDVTSPISFIIYTTPEIFAEEIESFDLEEFDFYFSVYGVEGDTIEIDVRSK